jgi:hypothetical protein
VLELLRLVAIRWRESGRSPAGRLRSWRRRRDGCAADAAALTPPASTPALGAIDLPSLHPNTFVVPAKNGGKDNMRLDICPQQGGGVRLHALLIADEALQTPTQFMVDGSVTSPTQGELVRIPEGMVFQIRVPPSAVLVEGLGEAIGGDLEGLRIRLLGERGLLIVGHPAFVAVGQGNVGTNSIEYTSLYVLVGGLAAGNTFAGLPCPLGEGFSEASFRLDTAELEVAVCTFPGGGITTGYRVQRLAIQDSNAALQEGDRRRFEFNTEAEVRSVLHYAWNHHNACDSFHLTLPHANYAASAAPAAGCGLQVPEAPRRSFDEPPGIPLLYRIRYYGGAWREGEVTGCFHVLRCM